jgi:tRNA-specific 2-thiouridylase
MTEERNRRALVAMSGGVDSSVCAYLMQQRGYDCIGVTMKLYQNETIGLSRGHTCCALDDVEDARSVARKLGMPFYVFNFTHDFEEKVIKKFVTCYEHGETPNPCLDCNRYLKFERLLHRARELGRDYIATGHYARIERDEASGRWILKKALDPDKDQSYVLYMLTQEQLSRTVFPLGDMTKQQTRALAEELGFVNAHKHDSQDICFVPDGDYAAFMERFTGKTYPDGDFIDENGKVVGRHSGAVRYTLGQRRGLGLAMGSPVYVCGKDMEKNTVTVAPESALFSRELRARDMNWISVPELTEPMRVTAKARYRQREQPATVYPAENGEVRLVFDEPQRAITPGQALVMYSGDTVVGGGTII